jgi:hypothetical protein
MASYLARVLGPMRGAATSAMTVLKTKVPQVAGYEAKVVEAYTSTMTTVRTKVVPQTMEAYKTTMAENAEYVVKDPEAADKLGRQFIFTNMAKCVTHPSVHPPLDTVKTPRLPAWYVCL